MSELLEKIIFLQKVTIFERLSLEELGEIAQIVDTEEYQEGEMLFQMGDPGTNAYILISGAVELTVPGRNGGRQTIKTIESGACFGEMALFDGKSRSASAEVAEESIIAKITRDDFLQLISSIPAIAIGIIEQISLQLRDSNRKYFALRYIGDDVIKSAERIREIISEQNWNE